MLRPVLGTEDIKIDDTTGTNILEMTICIVERDFFLSVQEPAKHAIICYLLTCTGTILPMLRVSQ